MTSNSKIRLDGVEVLRGLAALMVCIFHLCVSTGLSMEMSKFGQYGYLGIIVFFVLSGFVIPLSLFKSNYRIRSFFKFILKRIVRLHPPYLAVIALTLVYILLTRPAFLPSIKSLVLHLIYSNSYFSIPNISPVFWTLLIEIKFYFFLGLCYPLLTIKSQRTFILLIELVLAAQLFLYQIDGLFNYIAVFACGLILFRLKYLKLSIPVFILLIVQNIFLIAYTIGASEGIISILTIGFLYFIKSIPKNGVGDFFLSLGAISYSIYLLHWEFGRAMVSLSRYIPYLGKYEIFRLISAVLFTLILSSIFFILIEKPAIKLSNKIKMNRNSNS